MVFSGNLEAGSVARFYVTPLNLPGGPVLKDAPSILRNHSQITLLLLPILLTVVLVASFQSFPVLTPIFAFAAVLLLLLCLKPIAGVYIWLFLFPIQEINFKVSVYGHPHVHETHFVELFALLVIPVLLILALRRRGLPSQRRPVPAEFQFVYFFSAAFISWSLVNLLISPLPAEVTINWWVMMCNFPLCAFLILNMDEYDKFVRLIVFFCVVAALHSFIAIYSNLYDYDRHILFTNTHPFTIILAKRFMKGATGMSLASGFSGRHELGILLSCATAFAIFLAHRFKGVAARASLLFVLLLYATTQFIAIPKAALLGSAISFGIIVLAVPQWRRRAPKALIGFFALWFVANYLSSFLRPVFIKQHAVAISGGSLFEPSVNQPGTILNRLKLMREAIEIFASSNGLGAGPDSLQYLKINGVHGHNFFLTFAADYGVPGILFALCMVVLMGYFACSKILARPRPESRIWMLRAAILACLLMTVFEYSLDCFIWYSHLWFMTALFLASFRLPDNEQGGLPLPS
jgi:hypothetical protein